LPTDLFLADSSWPADSLTRVVPPSCDRGLVAAPAAVADGAHLRVTFPEWRPRVPAHRMVPALSALGESPLGFRFELSAFAAGAWSPWVAGATIGRARLPEVAARSETLVCEIDEFVANPPAERIRLVLRASGDAAGSPLVAPWCASLSAWSPGSDAPFVDGTSRLDVPALSQMEEDAAIRHRVCSPTCVAMVLAYHGHPVAVADLALEMFHPELDLYGVWPAAIRAASRRGVGGYLLRFPDWAAAAWCLERGMPVIASVRYGAGELTGAAVAETSGHLLVLTGHSGGDVFVNDPAAPRASEVTRRYRLDELRRVWLARSGVGYVLFGGTPPPPGAMSASAG
jgi:peptidase C39-like protein